MTQSAPALLPSVEAAIDTVPEFFRGFGWVAGEDREVVCSLDAGRHLIDVDRVGRFSVAPSGSSFSCLGTYPLATPEQVAEAAVGPPLVLALALQGVFCLHASAVTDGRHVVAIAGASGSGKSTLAGSLDGGPGGPWRRVADDVLPFTLENNRLVVLPRFPQLKISPDDQPWRRLPEKMVLTAICLLDLLDERARSPEAILLDRVGIRHGTAAILTRTVAARLFSPGLHRCHLEASAKAAEQVQVFRLSYPWGLEHLAQVGESLGALVSEFSTGPPSSGAQ